MADSQLNPASPQVNPESRFLGAEPQVAHASSLSGGRRVVFVHAHPDDETLATGATMAAAAASGDQVTLVTCTLGEEGEVVDESLSHLRQADDLALGRYRLGELTEAMAQLGVTDFVRLGGDHRFRDSGMQWAADGTATVGDTVREDSFWFADLQVAADELVAILRDRRPQVLVTYDDFGGYGHPDHVQAHRVAMYAVTLAAVPSYRRDLGPAWEVQRVLWSTMSRSAAREAMEALRAQGRDEDLRQVEDGQALDPDLPMLSEDQDLDVIVDGRDFVALKMAALKAYPSQIKADSPQWRLPPEVVESFMGREYYRFAGGVPLSSHPAQDIFEGL